MSRLACIVACAVVLAAAPRAQRLGGLPLPEGVVPKDLVVAGYTVHYLEAGEGSPVVLVHGLNADSRTWRSVIPVLARSHRVVAIDLLGFGQSDKPEIPYRVSTLTDILAGCIEALGIQKTAVVGNSLGGWVAAKYAVSHPDRVERLVLVDAAGYADDAAQLVGDLLSQADPAMAAMAQQMLRSTNPDDQKLVRAAAAAYFARRSPRGDNQASSSLAQSIVRGEDLLGAEMKTMAVPTLVVWGRDDPVISLRAADALATDIPGATKIVLDHCGHRPQNECSAAFMAAIGPFLAADRLSHDQPRPSGPNSEE